MIAEHPQEAYFSHETLGHFNCEKGKNSLKEYYEKSKERVKQNIYTKWITVYKSKVNTSVKNLYIDSEYIFGLF